MKIISDGEKMSVSNKDKFEGLQLIYEATSQVDIPLVKSILDEEDIVYLIKGEHLQNLFGIGNLGMGFNPIVGKTKFYVRQSDVIRSTELISVMMDSLTNKDVEMVKEGKLNFSKPTLLLNKQKCLQNLNFMVEKAYKNSLSFRPHFKTHQSAEIGEWFRGFGVNKITVSSVDMATYFALHDWDDITIAFPFNQRNMKEINVLSEKNSINILIINEESILFLKENLRHQIGFFIEIDTGYHRTGIDASNFTDIEAILLKAREVELLEFKGFLTHSGHNYNANSIDEITEISLDSHKKMRVLKDKFIDLYPNLILSIGDTPSCTLLNSFEGIDEIRPGNFIFYDVMQYKLNVCKLEQIAVSVCCPVVAKNIERNEIAIYGGAIHLSKEFIENSFLDRVYGLLALGDGRDFTEIIDGGFVKSLSQEHGICHIPQEYLSRIKVGDLLFVLPVHSCLTCNLLKEYHLISDDYSKKNIIFQNK